MVFLDEDWCFFLQFIHFFGEEEPFVIELDIASVDELFLHEEIVPSSLRQLIDSLKRSRVLSDPIIVDKKSGVVLDGTHRVSAFREMEFPYILVAYVDYSNKLIQLKRWFRVLNGPKDTVVEALRSVKHYEMRISDIDLSILDDEIAIIKDDSIFVVEADSDVFEKYSILRELERKLIKRGVSIDYVTEQEAIEFWSQGKTILMTPRITKQDVIKYAKQNRVFPPKSTRHVFPFRPIFVNFPLNLLSSSNIEKEMLRAILKEFLLNKIALKIEGRVIIDRFYEENYLLVFV